MSSAASNQPVENRLPPVSLFPSSDEHAQTCLSPGQIPIGPPSRPGVIGTIDRFELLEKIGEGGMGIVFLASDTDHKLTQSEELRRFAIKVLKPDLARDPRAVEYFFKEVRHMEQLTHPNILRLLDHSSRPERAYFVMPYLPKRSLDHLLKVGTLLEESLILRIALQIASALQFAHDRGIIHRDLKPSNILLDADDTAHLMDFGLSRSVFNDSRIDVGQRYAEGTPQYLSPAIAAGKDEDKRGDIYAFGALLYEMLTGRPPYSEPHRERVLQQIRHGPPPPIRVVNPRGSLKLTAIAEGAMARELHKRYADMDALVADLERVKAGRIPVGPTRSMFQWCHNAILTYRLFVLMMLFAIGVVLLGVVIYRFVHVTYSLRLVRTIESPGIWNWSETSVDDYDNDGKPELFVSHFDRLFVVSNQGQILRSWYPQAAGVDQVYLSFRRNADADGAKETFVTWRSGTNLALSVMNPTLFEIQRFEVCGELHTTPNGTRINDSSYYGLKLADMNHDGRKELFAFLFTGYERKPRELQCYDYAQKTLLWQYPLGPAIGDFEIADLDGDGLQELVFGSNAVDNGNQADDGTDDHHSYIYCLSHTGKQRWIRRLSGIYSQSHLHVADFNRDGKKSLVAWVQEGGPSGKSLGEGARGEILRIDEFGNTMARFATTHRIEDCKLGDLDGDGAPEILVADDSGQLHCLGPDLTLRATVRVVRNTYDLVQLSVAAVSDLNGDGAVEIVLRCARVEYVQGSNAGHPDGELNVRIFHEPSIIVLNSFLQPIARHVVSERMQEGAFYIKVADLDGDRKQKILLFTDKVHVMELVRGAR